MLLTFHESILTPLERRERSVRCGEHAARVTRGEESGEETKARKVHAETNRRRDDGNVFGEDVFEDGRGREFKRRREIRGADGRFEEESADVFSYRTRVVET